MSLLRFNDLNRQHKTLSRELTDAFQRVLDHKEFIQGREVTAFEKSWAEYTGAKYAIGCSNGTDAIMLALMAVGVKGGDEVITVSHTFFATVEAIVCLGAKPVLIDIRQDTGLMDASLLQAAITSKTKAIIPVHLYGQPADMKSILAIANRHNVQVIEDAAQAHAAYFDGKHAGTMGAAGTFSFFPGKNLGAMGDAGGVVTNDEALAKEMRVMRDHGRRSKYEHDKFGWNMRMDGMQAAVLNVKLPMLNKWTEQRRSIAKIYDQGLQGITGLTLPFAPAAAVSSQHLYVVRHEDRDGLASALKEVGIETGIHYPLGCHEQPAWRSMYGEESLPVTEKFNRTCLSLPMFGDMTDSEAERVVEAIRGILRA